MLNKKIVQKFRNQFEHVSFQADWFSFLFCVWKNGESVQYAYCWSLKLMHLKYFGIFEGFYIESSRVWL